MDSVGWVVALTRLLRYASLTQDTVKQYSVCIVVNSRHCKAILCLYCSMAQADGKSRLGRRLLGRGPNSAGTVGERTLSNRLS